MKDRLYYVSEEVKQHLIEQALSYSDDELYRYKCDIGWEDWMHEFSPYGESVSEAEYDFIDSILKEAFEIAHKNRIKVAREAAGLTQAQMSEIFEIPKRTIGNWETGDRKPPVYVEKLIIEKLMQMKK